MSQAKRYAVLGTTAPDMLGRRQIFDRIRRNQEKASPDHLSIVGPRYIGKTVLLNHVVKFFRAQGKPYLAVVHWDMRHQTPESDGDFLRMFAVLVKDQLERCKSEFAEYLVVDDPQIYSYLKYVMAALDGAGQKILTVMDGCDYALASNQLSRNLWNNIRRLAEGASLCLLTGSSKPLRELCQSEDAASSDFWELFADSTISLGPIDADDWTAMIEPLIRRGITVDKSACSELVNWCCNQPMLAASLLGAIDGAMAGGGEVRKDQVDGLAHGLLRAGNSRSLIESVWASCDPDLQIALAGIPADRDADTLPAPEVAGALLARGVIRQANRGLRSSRLLYKVSEDMAPSIDRVRDLFQPSAAYQTNMRAALEVRLSALNGVDEKMRGLVQRAIRELDPDPQFVVVWARSIASRALQLIWAAELGGSRDFPKEWIDAWKYGGVGNIPQDNRLPSEEGRQCNTLRLIVGTARIDRLSKVVSKPTALLVIFLHSVGDYGQHQEGEIRGSFGTSVCHAAVELCEALTIDLEVNSK
jgi:hypothetical protein